MPEDKIEEKISLWESDWQLPSKISIVLCTSMLFSDPFVAKLGPIEERVIEVYDDRNKTWKPKYCPHADLLLEDTSTL